MLPVLLLKDRDEEEARAKSWEKQAKGSWLERSSRPLSLRGRSCQGISRARALPLRYANRYAQVTPSTSRSRAPARAALDFRPHRPPP